MVAASSAYAKAATASAMLRVSIAPEGTRNRTLRDEGYSLGRLVGAGTLDIAEAERVLLYAATSCGLEEREAQSVVRRALRDGARAPRVLTPSTGGSTCLPGGWRATPERTMPPVLEVAGLWASCTSVEEDAEVSRWIRERGLAPDAVALEGLARALPTRAPLPRWARGPGGSWSEGGRRLIVPLYDARGILVTLRARAVRQGIEPKSLAPAGHAMRGAVMADLVGAALLRSETSEGWNGVVVVVEGEPDHLTWASNRSDALEAVPAVFGVESGAWTEEIGARIPYGATVVLRTHHDAAGDQYAQAVIQTLGERCRVFRSRRLEIP